jgi:hypothetical protein
MHPLDPAEAWWNQEIKTLFAIALRQRVAELQRAQDELQVLQTIRSLTLADLDELVREGKESGSTDALREMFAFALSISKAEQKWEQK